MPGGAATCQCCCLLQAQVSYSALPQADPNSLQQRLQQCADLASQQQLPAAIQLLDDVIEWQLEDFAGRGLLSGSSSSLAAILQQASSSGVCPASPYLVPACVYAVLLNLFDPATQELNRRSGSSSSKAGAAESIASPDSSRPSSPDNTAGDDEDMFDAVDSPASLPAALARRSIVSDRDSPLQRLAKFQLEQLEKAAPADELAPVAACLGLLLGHKHPVAAAMQLLAERNMSPGARQARALRQQQKQLAMATELLKVGCWLARLTEWMLLFPGFALDVFHLASWPDCVYRLAVSPFVCEWRAAIQHSVGCGFSTQEICCRRHMLRASLLCVQDSPVGGQGGLDPQGARLRQQLVPAPERIWALRNVANSMLRSTASSGGSGSSGSSTPSAEEAVSMLHQAADLAAEHYGKNHPGVSNVCATHRKASLSQLDRSGDSICSYWLQWHRSIMSLLCVACSKSTPPCFMALLQAACRLCWTMLVRCWWCRGTRLRPRQPLRQCVPLLLLLGSATGSRKTSSAWWCSTSQHKLVGSLHCTALPAAVGWCWAALCPELLQLLLLLLLVCLTGHVVLQSWMCRRWLGASVSP